MSFTEPQIEIHFEKLQALAGNISETAEHLRNIAGSDGMKVAADLKNAWAGEKADIFVQKEVKLMNEVCDIAQDLKSISGKIEEKAKLYYELEKINVLMANARIY